MIVIQDSLYVGTLVLGLIFPAVSPSLIVAGLAFAAAAYTIPDGLNSVVKTEVIQVIVLVFGSCILTYYTLSEVGIWSSMMAQLDELKTQGVTDKNAHDALSIIRENSNGP